MSDDTAERCAAFDAVVIFRKGVSVPRSPIKMQVMRNPEMAKNESTPGTKRGLMEYQDEWMEA